GAMPASRLTRARGLKPYFDSIDEFRKASRLTQARGLKHETVHAPSASGKSRLTQARGLKLAVVDKSLTARVVAPHAGARIETSHGRRYCAPSASRLTQARGLKRPDELAHVVNRLSRLTQARGLKPEDQAGIAAGHRRASRRRVDRSEEHTSELQSREDLVC